MTYEQRSGCAEGSAVDSFVTDVDWMGKQVSTLADVWPDVPRAVIVGINPAPTSVRAGHYYQGPVGRTQMRRLAEVGAFRVTGAGRYYEKYALAAGIGFTDIVKRPTARATDVRDDEIRFGANLLEHKLSSRNVPVVICVFKPVADVLGCTDGAGVQSRRTSWGATVFRMPGPYESNEKAGPIMRQLIDVLPPPT